MPPVGEPDSNDTLRGVLAGLGVLLRADRMVLVLHAEATARAGRSPHGVVLAVGNLLRGPTARPRDAETAVVLLGGRAVGALRMEREAPIGREERVLLHVAASGLAQCLDPPER